MQTCGTHHPPYRAHTGGRELMLSIQLQDGGMQSVWELRGQFSALGSEVEEGSTGDSKRQC